MDEQPPFQRHPGLDPGSRKNDSGRLDSRLRGNRKVTEGNDVQEGLIHIRVDDREAGSGLVEVLRAQDDTCVVVERLPVGDYAVDGRRLFEHKTLVDLAASIKGGRLFRQAGQLASAPQPGVLILEGTGRDLSIINMRREAIQGALIYLMVRLNLPLLRARDPEENARLMLYAARQLRAQGVEHPPACPRPVPAGRPAGKRRQQLYVLQALPGIGIRTAIAIRHVVSEAQIIYNVFV